MPLDVFVRDLYDQLANNSATEVLDKLFDLDENSRLRVKPGVRWAFYTPPELSKADRRAGRVNGPALLALWDEADGDRAALYSLGGKCAKRLTLSPKLLEAPVFEEPDHEAFEATLVGLSSREVRRRRHEFYANRDRERKALAAYAHREPWQFLLTCAQEFSQAIADRATARAQRELSELRAARDPDHLASEVELLKAQVQALLTTGGVPR